MMRSLPLSTVFGRLEVIYALSNIQTQYVTFSTTIFKIGIFGKINQDSRII
jgi:hypothetical protein